MGFFQLVDVAFARGDLIRLPENSVRRWLLKWITLSISWRTGWKLKQGTIDASNNESGNDFDFYTITFNLLIIGLEHFVVSIFPPKRPKHKAVWYQYRAGAGFYCSSLGKQSNKSDFWWLMFALRCGMWGGIEQKRVKFEAIENNQNRRMVQKSYDP